MADPSTLLLIAAALSGLLAVIRKLPRTAGAPYRCAACGAELVGHDASMFRMHCPRCGAQYRRIGGEVMTLAAFGPDVSPVPAARALRPGHAAAEPVAASAEARPTAAADRPPLADDDEPG